MTKPPAALLRTTKNTPVVERATLAWALPVASKALRLL
jgi:hypothetical protein